MARLLRIRPGLELLSKPHFPIRSFSSLSPNLLRQDLHPTDCKHRRDPPLASQSIESLWRPEKQLQRPTKQLFAVELVNGQRPSQSPYGFLMIMHRRDHLDQYIGAVLELIKKGARCFLKSSQSESHIRSWHDQRNRTEMRYQVEQGVASEKVRISYIDINPSYSLRASAPPTPPLPKSPRNCVDSCAAPEMKAFHEKF